MARRVTPAALSDLSGIVIGSALACVFLVLAADIAWRPGWESDGCSAMVQFAFSHYAGVVEVIFRNNRLRSVGAWIWNRGQDLLTLSLPVLIVLKLTGVIAWSWWWVLLSPLWISGQVATFRFNRPGSVGAWIWNRGQDLWILSLPVLIVLKLTGVIAWSWWWVLSPLWISGILLAPVLCALLVLLGRHIYRARAASNA
jgi:hypothetical protein